MSSAALTPAIRREVFTQTVRRCAPPNATLNVTNADVTGTYCDVFVTGATANLFGGTYTNTNEYINHEPINYSPLH